MVTENKIEKRYKTKESSARLKSLKNYQCDWCRRLLQNPSGLIRHRTYCVWNPELKNNVQGTLLNFPSAHATRTKTAPNLTYLIKLKEFSSKTPAGTFMS